VKPRHLHAQATAAVCNAMGHMVESGGHPRAWDCLIGTSLVTAVFNVFTDAATQADLTEDIATWLTLLDQAWDAPADKATPEWQAERARVAVTTLLTRLGHGTPSMRDEFCPFEFPDGSTCVYGRHHAAKNHCSPAGVNVPAAAPVNTG
jgi:hypothetical protein